MGVAEATAGRPRRRADVGTLAAVWAFDQRQVLDDAAALARGHVLPDGKPAMHGTYTRLRYVVVRLEVGDALTVFDDQGQLARFVPTGGAEALTWAASSDPVTFTADHPVLGRLSRTVRPSLVLARYGEDAPSQHEPGDLFLSSSDDASAVAAQTLTLSTVAKTLVWEDPMLGRLTFSPIDVQRGDPETPVFGDTFAGQSDFTQTAFPFYGFDPRHMHLYSEAGSFDQPGTSAPGTSYEDNPGQTFIAPLLFRFPAANSHDYNRSPDLARQPNLPIGRRWELVETHAEQQQSRMISSVADRMDSWSVSFGLCAEIEGILSLGGKFSHHDKVEQQQEHKSRYVVARSVDVGGVDLMHLPSLTLHDTFVAWLTQATYDVLAGRAPDWAAFVGHFGTHYLHSLTHGGLRYSETRLSLEAELNAHTAGFDVKAEASALMDGGKLSSKGSYAEEWATKLQTAVESEDVSCYQIGGRGAEAVGIFYDLRPISELLNPLLVRYSPAKAWESLAPWVWTDVRASLEDHLASLGMGRPVPAELSVDYTPRIITVAFQGITLSSWADADCALTGKITLEAVPAPDGQVVLDQSPLLPLPGLNLRGKPPYTWSLEEKDSRFHSTVAVHGGEPVHVRVRTSLGAAFTVWLMETYGELLEDGTNPPAEAVFLLDQTIEVEVPEGGQATATVGPIPGALGPHARGGYAITLHLHLQETDRM